MNFSDEEYVRLYTTDTVTWDMLPWQAHALLALGLRKFDRSGVFEFGRHGAERSLASKTRLPLEVVSIGLQALLDEEVWLLEPTRIFWPKYIEAQTCRRSDRVRQRMSRARRGSESCDDERDIESRNVTVGHEPNPNVTNVTECHPRRGEARQGIDPSLIGSSDLGASDARAPEEPTTGSVTKISTGARRFAQTFETEAPDQLEFTAEHREYAQHHKLNLQECWEHCRDYRRARKDRRECWQAEFMAWLRNEVKLRRTRTDRTPPVKAPRQPNSVGGFGDQLCATAQRGGG